MTRYWLRGPEDDEFQEVTRAEYVTAEREHGFYNTLGRPDEPATAAFSANGTRGTTLQRQGQPIPDTAPAAAVDAHHYFSPTGDPITVEQWAEYRREPTLRETAVAAQTTVKTVYLGYVDASIAEARLFGTALIESGQVHQIEVHDSEQDALIRHMANVEAIRAGQHCARCNENRPHIN